MQTDGAIGPGLYVGAYDREALDAVLAEGGLAPEDAAVGVCGAGEVEWLWVLGAGVAGRCGEGGPDA